MADVSETIRAWWCAELGDRTAPAARGLAARLRRATSPVDVVAEPAVQRLVARLGRSLQHRARVIPLAQSIAFVRTHDAMPLAGRLGPGLKEPALSPQRFERLLRTRPDALPMALRRVLPMAQYTCDVGALGADILFWNEQTRIRWTFEYYQPPVRDAGDASKPSEETLP